jgi:hypothetical protein
MASMFDFRFWKDSALQVSVYRWATPAAMSDAGTVRLLGPLIAGALAFLLRKSVKNRRTPAITERTSFLLGGFAFALVMLQSALVRSDYGHIVIASFAMMLLTGTILFSFDSRALSTLLVFLATVCSGLVSRPALVPSAMFRLVQQVRHPLSKCPSGFREFDRGCFAPEFTSMLESASGFLGQHSRPDEHVVVFPYQTKFGIAAGRTIGGGLMQAYTASGPELAQLEIGGLESSSTPAGLCLPDADMVQLSNSALVQWRNLDLSLPVDGAYNFTRTPEVWFWMQRHYRSAGELSTGVVGLLRDDSRASHISMQGQTLGLAARTYPIHERSSAVDLGVPDWPLGADFLRLRLTVRFPFWWKLRKPSRMQVEITRTDGSIELRRFLIQPNAPMEVWFYPWSQPDLVRYFEPDDSNWRSTPRPAITRLRILTTPLDWVSVAPDAIVVEEADAVRVAMN